MPLDDRSWATFVGSLDDATKRRLVQYVAGLNQAEARAYQPSMRDRLGAAIAGDSRPGDVRYNLAQGLVGSAGVGGSGIGLGDFTPAGIPMAASDAAKYAREGDYMGAGLSAAGVVAPGLKSGRAAMAGAANAADETAKGIRAYHGSPHDFDRFSLDKIGTGEGAQAYGHGLYFAESEGIARHYRDALTSGAGSWSVDGKNLAALHLSTDPADRLKYEIGIAARQGKTPEDAIAYVMQQKRGMLTSRRTMPEDVPVLREEIAALEGMLKSPPRIEKGGKMYEVNIRANPDDFLDWDKPLSEQPESVRNAIPKLLENAPEPRVKPAARNRQAIQAGDGSVPGDVIWNNLGGYKYPEETRKRFIEAGVPGIKYLDAGSRAAGDGSRNYVVFDDSLIEILRKYGLLAPIGAAAAGSALLGDAEAERY